MRVSGCITLIIGLAFAGCGGDKSTMSVESDTQRSVTSALAGGPATSAVVDASTTSSPLGSGPEATIASPTTLDPTCDVVGRFLYASTGPDTRIALLEAHWDDPGFDRAAALDSEASTHIGWANWFRDFAVSRIATNDALDPELRGAFARIVEHLSLFLDALGDYFAALADNPPANVPTDFDGPDWEGVMEHVDDVERFAELSNAYGYDWSLVESASESCGLES